MKRVLRLTGASTLVGHSPTSLPRADSRAGRQAFLKPPVWTLMAAAITLALGSCTQHPATAHGPAFLRLVPADSPYVFAALAPAPAGYMEHTLADAGPKLKKDLAHLRAVGAAAQGPGIKLALTILDEVSDNLSVEGFERIGLGVGVHGVIYGVGLIPVARWEVKDGVKLHEFLANLFVKIGAQVTSSTLGKHEFWTFPIGERGLLTMVIGVDGNELIMTLAPLATLDKVLPIAFGDRKPAHSLADDDVLGRIVADYGFTPFGVGFVDLVKVASVLTDESAPGRELLGPLAAALPSLSPECRSDVAEIAGTAPRLVFGLSQLGPGSTRGSMTIELRPELVAALSLLEVPVPGLGAPLGDSIIQFGGGLNVPRAVDFAKLEVAALQAHPFRCPHLAHVNRAVDKLASALQRPLPDFIADIRGGVVVLDELKVASGIDVKGTLVAIDVNPAKSLKLLQDTLPPFAGLKVPTDGTPVTLPTDFLPLLPASWIAMKGQALGIAMGQGSDAKLARALAAPTGSDQPFLYVSYDSARWNAVVSQLGELAAGMGVDGGRGKIELSVGVNKHGLALGYGLSQ